MCNKQHLNTFDSQILAEGLRRTIASFITLNRSYLPYSELKRYLSMTSGPQFFLKLYMSGILMLTKRGMLRAH